MKRPIFFSDLDDTVFQTARKMDGVPAPENLASEALNGSHSYMSPAQAAMMEWLLASTRFIPVTARSTKAIGRCRLPFQDYQICTNGAVILWPDGRPDSDWLRQTQSQADMRDLTALLDFVQTQTEPGKYRSWIVEEYGTGYYFCVKSNSTAAALDQIDHRLTMLAGGRLVRHRNDNNLSFTPKGISKRHAVEYLLRTHLHDNTAPVFGMGDSLTDLPFMAVCDMMVIPRASQISREIFHTGAA
ncbi:HAD family hydrolase [Oceaniglobus ichthyenteri]|uniref:HAD family hydrolase n=1 Tax=Oceaniglobus ichthyenteri TaxID=2136177 RepID=UPI000D355492|nr:HAD family hydrolase [Oceaniglobus ichthyenteri]